MLVKGATGHRSAIFNLVLYLAALKRRPTVLRTIALAKGFVFIQRQIII